MDHWKFVIYTNCRNIKIICKENQNYNGNENGNNDGVSFTEYTKKDGRRHSSFRSYIAPLFENKEKNVCIFCIY